MLLLIKCPGGAKVGIYIHYYVYILCCTNIWCYMYVYYYVYVYVYTLYLHTGILVCNSVMLSIIIFSYYYTVITVCTYYYYTILYIYYITYAIGIKHRKNEIFLDVVEKLNLLVSSNGTVLHSEIIGEVQMKSFLSGIYKDVYKV